MKKILRWMYGLLGLGICAAIVVLLFNLGLIGGFSVRDCLWERKSPAAKRPATSLN